MILVSRGLSPRMRGNRNLRRFAASISGSIPAHAGQPAIDGRDAIISRVYPRACGATTPVATSKSTTSGLSPRMRGNLIFCPARALRAGSIPAHAGQPHITNHQGQTRRVYPRACGATARPVPIAAPKRGLSPRMRGNRCKAVKAACQWGSIPAHAGQPSLSAELGLFCWVYPRACGATVVKPAVKS